MEQTVKKKFGIRDIMTIAAMMVLILSQWLSALSHCLFR